MNPGIAYLLGRWIIICMDMTDKVAKNVSGACFNDNIAKSAPNIMINGGDMLKLSEFCHSQHSSGVKMMAKISDLEFRIDMNNE